VNLDDLEHYLFDHIPISHAMGVRAVSASPALVRLSAPLGANINHRGTGFGGSVSALAILAGWSLLWVRTQSVGFSGHLVIHRNRIDYVRPVEGPFEAVCQSPTDAEWTTFDAMLGRSGRGRITIRSHVEVDGIVCAQFEGVYVALTSTEDRR